VSPELRRLIQRLYPDGRSASACAFRRDYAALDRRLGPFDGVANFATGVIVLGLEFQDATRELKTAQEARQRKKGRRPSEQAIERRKRRQGLAWQSYAQALRELEERVKRMNSNGHADPLMAVRAAVAEANR
jgi:hypothetical protein